MTLKINAFYDYKVETAPAKLPLTLDEVEAHLKLAADSEDTYLTFLIKSVRDFFEKYTNRVLINTTFKGFLDQFPDSPYCYDFQSDSYVYYNDTILIKKSKVTSITSIKYYIDSVLTTWSSDNYYFTNDNHFPEVLLKENMVYPETDYKKQAVEIIFVAGYGANETDIPSDIKMALLNHIAFLYENRGDCSENGCVLPCPTKTIYEQYRIKSLGWES